MTPRDPASRLVRNVLSNWGAFVCAAAVSFLLSPYIVRTLGDSAYGAWAVLNSVVGYLGLLDLGVRGAVMRYVARFHDTGEHDRAGRLTSSAVLLFGATACVAVILAIVLAANVEHAFNLPADVVHAARIVALVGGLNIAVALVDGVFGGVITGLHRFDYSNAIDLSALLLRSLATVVGLALGGGLVALALIQLGGSLLRLAADYTVCRRLYPQLRVRLRDGDREHLQIVLRFGLASSVLHVAGQIMLYSDSVIIGAFLPVAFVTYFAIAANLTDYARQVISGISRVLTPLLSATEARGQEERVRQTLLAGARLTTLCILPITVTFIVRGATFIGLWMGPQYAKPSGRVLAVLAVFVTCHAGYQVITASMLGINRHRGLIPVFLADAATNVGLSIFLVPRIGIIGSALGTLIPQLVVTLVIGPWYVRRELGVSMAEFWRNAHVRPVLSMVPFALVSILIERSWAAPNLLIFFSQVALSIPFGLLGAWLFGLLPNERQLIMRTLASRRLAEQGSS